MVTIVTAVVVAVGVLLLLFVVVAVANIREFSGVSYLKSVSHTPSSLTNTLLLENTLLISCFHAVISGVRYTVPLFPASEPSSSEESIQDGCRFNSPHLEYNLFYYSIPSFSVCCASPGRVELPTHPAHQLLSAGVFF